MVEFPERSMIAATAVVIALALGGSAVSGSGESHPSGGRAVPAKVAAADPHPELATLVVHEANGHAYESELRRRVLPPRGERPAVSPRVQSAK